MEKVNMVSRDIVGSNIEKIRVLFPNCITEIKNANGELEHAIDFDKLKQELSRNLVDGKKERYEFTWSDKRQAIVTANSPISKTLRPVREKSVDFDNTQNVYIEGDNLDALKLLQETYLGKIKMIYIDPPYNTGNDFVYNDKFSQNAEDYLKSTGDADEQGNRLTANKDSNGRFHTDWLNMMYPRLKLAKDLLSDDGAIFISIDDNEVENLKKICNEIFGEQNFLAQLIWRKIYGIKNDVKTFSVCHDFIVAYSKTIDNWHPTLLPRTEEANARYKNPDDDPRGDWKPGDFTGVGATSSTYPITSPSGKVFLPPEGKHWIASKENYYKLLADNRMYFGPKGESLPSIKRFLSEVKNGLSPSTFLDYTEVGHTDEANRQLRALMDGAFFDYPKPVKLLHRLVYIGTSFNSIILDFFSGSATTAHAVMKLNEEDGGNRKFIMVQFPEICDDKSEAKKAGYNTICDIGEERIRRAGKKIKEEAGLLADNLDVGFRVFKIDESNMKDVYYLPEDLKQEDLFSVSDNIKEDRTPEDLLFQVMIDDFGIPLSAKIEKIIVAGKTIFNVENNFLVACFDSGVTDEVVTAMAKLEPKYAVLRDSSYEDDSVAANFEQIFNKYSPSTTKKVL